MKLVKAALATALIGTGLVPLLPATGAAEAQVLDSIRQRTSRRPRAQACRIQVEQGHRPYNLSQAECVALLPVVQAITAGDNAAAQAALPAAQAGARSADARYAVAQAQLRIGIATNDTALQQQAIDAIIASGGASAQEMPRLLAHQVEFAIQARDFARAEQGLTRLSQLDPNNPDLIVQRAGLRVAQNDRPGALVLYQQAIRASEAANRPVPALWRSNAFALAYELRNTSEALALSRALVTAQPTPANWRVALLSLRELGGLTGPAQLDLYRLMRVAGALTSERDYVEYAQAAQGGAMFGEAKAVLEAGMAANAITPANLGFARELLGAVNRRVAADQASLPAERTRAMAGASGVPVLRLADAYYGYGRYAEAAELYRAALQKGGVDAGTANVRLGAALALAGRRAEAEAAFRLVTGARAPLASYWMLWLATRPAV